MADYTPKSRHHPGEVVTLAHGGGGTRMRWLLEEVIFPGLGEQGLSKAEDAALLDLPPGQAAFTTDTFVVTPLFFPGGDIGKLAVCGTVNDLAMRGATPLFLSVGMVLEEGLALETLRTLAGSLGYWAKKAGVRLVTGDTKVVERGKADGIYINTSGLGVVAPGRGVSISGASPGDVLLISGPLGDHGSAVLARREGFSFQEGLDSDCAPLSGLVEAMLDAGRVTALRDLTRGGLAAACTEMALASGCSLELEETGIPVRRSVRAFCEMLGLDPLLVACEGRLLAAVEARDAGRVLEAMRLHPLGSGSATAGSVVDGRTGEVTLVTPMGTRRFLRMPSGEQLPRIC